MTPLAYLGFCAKARCLFTVRQDISTVALSQRIIDTIRNTLRIEDVIARYLPDLTRRGNNYIALCPFHKEKTPSFSVSADKQIFHCFGCHAGGNIFTFVMKIENMSFPQAVEHLAAIANIPLENGSDKNGKKDEKALYSRINRYTAEVYHRYLCSDAGQGALAYIKGRGISEETIRQFKLGYAPEEWTFLRDRLSSKGISYEMAERAGVLIKSSKKDSWYDRFRDRLMFPIASVQGDVIAFGGRVIEKGEPKYLNSPENELFQKRYNLYGLDIVQAEIRTLRRALIVEGYLDMIGLYQGGIHNVVAPLGTALTVEQLTLLSRFCDEIVLLFDGDSAGKKASVRGAAFAHQIRAQLKVASLPENGTDPFDYIKQKGSRMLMSVIDSAVSADEYLINEIVDNQGLAVRQRLASLFTHIRQIELKTEQQRLLEYAASRLHVEPQALLSDFKSETSPAAVLAQKVQVKENFEEKTITELIRLLFMSPELIKKAVIDFSDISFKGALADRILKKIFHLYESVEELTVDRLFDYFTEEGELSFINETLAFDNQYEDVDSVYTELYLHYRLYLIDKKIEFFTGELRKDRSDASSADLLAEIDIWRREKEKFVHFLSSRETKGHKKVLTF